MYDLSSELNKFYREYVVLPEKDKSKLREKRRINIDRLNDGLKEYNKENKTSYKIIEILEQGSVAMGTVNQNESNEYDIDIAIIFEETNIIDIGPEAIKNIVVDALKRKCTSLKTPPEALANCVRIVYSDNYHIDFAIYKRIEEDNLYKYQHAGGKKWRDRDPRAINNWFKNSIKEKGENLRKVIRLLKMFSKSRAYWQMPGGLIQTVLCEEQFVKEDRLDKCFYKTLHNISDRLDKVEEVNNPTEPNRSLLLKEKDKEEVSNLRKRLKKYLKKLEALYDDDCNKEDAIEVWGEVFNHEYWNNLGENLQKSKELVESVNKKDIIYNDTEEFIYNLYPIDIRHKIELKAYVYSDIEKKPTNINYINSLSMKVRKGSIIHFKVDVYNIDEPYSVYWKVRNKGEEAKKRDCIRGTIFGKKNNSSFSDLKHSLFETADFEGRHFVEVYIIKNNICIAKDKIDVPI